MDYDFYAAGIPEPAEPRYAALALALRATAGVSDAARPVVLALYRQLDLAVRRYRGAALQLPVPALLIPDALPIGGLSWPASTVSPHFLQVVPTGCELGNRPGEQFVRIMVLDCSWRRGASGSFQGLKLLPKFGDWQTQSAWILDDLVALALGTAQPRVVITGEGLLTPAMPLADHVAAVELAATLQKKAAPAPPRPLPRPQGRRPRLIGAWAVPEAPDPGGEKPELE